MRVLGFLFAAIVGCNGGGKVGVDDSGPAGTTGSTTGTATGTGTGTGACTAWEVTYDLTGSTFEISDTPLGAGDQVNTLQEPYDADDTVGPGTLVLRFGDVGGTPGGRAAIASYVMSMHFVVDSGFTTVATDLENDAGPSDCGLTTGTLAADTVAWAPSAIVGHHSVGQLLCNGSFCGLAGLPDGTPQPIDETSDQPVSDFVFASDLSGFTMAPTVVQQDANSTSSWAFTGTETARQSIAAPSCWCK